MEARTLSENKTLCPISRQERNNVSSDIPKGFNWKEARRLCVFILYLRNDVNTQICYSPPGVLARCPRYLSSCEMTVCVAQAVSFRFLLFPAPELAAPASLGGQGHGWCKCDPLMHVGMGAAAGSRLPPTPLPVHHWAWQCGDQLGRE